MCLRIGKLLCWTYQCTDAAGWNPPLVLLGVPVQLPQRSWGEMNNRARHGFGRWQVRPARNLDGAPRCVHLRSGPPTSVTRPAPRPHKHDFRMRLHMSRLCAVTATTSISPYTVTTAPSHLWHGGREEREPVAELRQLQRPERRRLFKIY